MKNPRLLLVDDEVLFTTNLSKLLTRRGYDVTAVNNGEQALQIVQEHEFDVVILDQQMPGMDGIAVLRNLKSTVPDLEVIMLTGHGSVEMGITGLQLGAYDFIRKPIALNDLEEKIASAFDRKVLRESKELLT
jgi:DNA-binding NtrC family response regulator